jgi:phosphate-selective porin OprO/OprP
VIARYIVTCLLFFFLIFPVAFSQNVVDKEISKIQESIRYNQESIRYNKARLNRINREKQKQYKKIQNANLDDKNRYPILLSKKELHSPLLALDYTRYPANPYPSLFQYTSEDQTNHIEFHMWYQGDWDSLMNIHGLSVNDGVLQTTIGRSNSIQRLWNRRIRPTIQGDAYDFINYFLNVDFGRSSLSLYDSFVDINYFRILGVQFGKQMSLLSGIENYFDNFSYLSRAYTMEMSHTAMLAPNRQTGLMLHGSFGPSGDEPYYQGLSLLGFDDFFSYQMGVFTSVADNTSAAESYDIDSLRLIQNPETLSYDFQLRLFANPFIKFKNSFLKHLGFGIGLGTSQLNNQYDLPSLNSIGQNTFYNYESNKSINNTIVTGYSVIANGLRTRIHPQAVWSYDALGIIADWTQTNQTLALYNNDSGTYPYQTIKQSNSASMITFIYNLTHEEFNLFHLIPNNNFHLFQKNQYGAWQMVFRLSQLNLDPSVFKSTYTKVVDGKESIFYNFVDPRTSIQKANSWSIGLNWYWNQFLRFTFEYDQSSYTGGCSTGGYDSALGSTGCQVFSNPGTYLAGSQVRNRPDEKIIMQRIQVTF